MDGSEESGISAAEGIEAACWIVQCIIIVIILISSLIIIGSISHN